MHPYEKKHIFQFGIRKQIDSSKEILNMKTMLED